MTRPIDELEVLVAAAPAFQLYSERDRTNATPDERLAAKAYFIGYLSGRLFADGQISQSAWSDGVAATIAMMLGEREEQKP